MVALSITAVIPILVALGSISTALWIYADAEAHAEQGTPVAFSAGSLEVGTPSA